MAQNKLWGGRFTQPTDKFVEEFTASIAFDQRLYAYDIRGSKAHAEMLGRQGIISVAEAGQICAGLDAILADIEAGHVSAASCTPAAVATIRWRSISASTCATRSMPFTTT
jgi:argininosuccinate lyase